MMRSLLIYALPLPFVTYIDTHLTFSSLLHSHRSRSCPPPPSLPSSSSSRVCFSSVSPFSFFAFAFLSQYLCVLSHSVPQHTRTHTHTHTHTGTTTAFQPLVKTCSKRPSSLPLSASPQSNDNNGLGRRCVCVCVYSENTSDKKRTISFSHLYTHTHTHTYTP